MAGNYGAPIDLTDSPQDRVANRHPAARVYVHQGPAVPKNVGPPAINPQGLAQNGDLMAHVERMHEEAAQRARDGAQRARDAAQRARDEAQRVRDAAQRIRDEAQRTREAAHMQAAQARRLAQDARERAERHRNAVQEQRAAHDQARLHREAIQANVRRQGFLRQQRARARATPAVAEVQGEHPGEEWERRGQRVAEDIQRRLQERAARRQQELADTAENEFEVPEAIVRREPQQLPGHPMGGHNRQADEGGAGGGLDLGMNGKEMRRIVRAHRRQADEGGHGGVAEAVDEGHIYRLQHLQEIAARNEIQERARKRSRLDEGGTGGGLATAEVSERNMYVNHERTHVHVEAARGDDGAGPSGRGADVGGERRGGAVEKALGSLAEIFPDVDLEAAREVLLTSIAQHVSKHMDELKSLIGCLTNCSRFRFTKFFD